ncbi:lipopolysaccharide assembly protein LapA domain-containing protein [Acuticoccus sediminis]|nr:LapA family protein [Acuticoccus sediminis]
MHRINSIIAVVLVILIAIFAIQNTGSVTVALFSWSLTAPLAVVVIGVYVLGMLTGTTLWAALRRPLRERKAG